MLSRRRLLLGAVAASALAPAGARAFIAGTYTNPPAGQAFVGASSVTTVQDSPAGTLRLPDVSNVGLYTAVAGHANIPAGAIVTGINSTLGTVTTSPVTTGTVPSGTTLTFGSTLAATNLAAKVLLRGAANPPLPTSYDGNDKAYINYPCSHVWAFPSSPAVRGNNSSVKFAAATWAHRTILGWSKKEINDTYGAITYSFGGATYNCTTRFSTYAKAIAAWLAEAARQAGYLPFNDTLLAAQIGQSLVTYGYTGTVPTAVGWVQFLGMAGFDVSAWSSLVFAAATAAAGSSGVTVNLSAAVPAGAAAGQILWGPDNRELGVLASTPGAGDTFVTLTAAPKAAVSAGDALHIADPVFSRSTSAATGDVMGWDYAKANAAALYTTFSTTTAKAAVAIDKFNLARWRGCDVPNLGSLFADFEPDDDPGYTWARARTQMFGQIAHGKGLTAFLSCDTLTGAGAHTSMDQTNLWDIATHDIDGINILAAVLPPSGDQVGWLQTQLRLFTGPDGTKTPPTSNIYVQVPVGAASAHNLMPEAYAAAANAFALAPTLPGFTGLAPMAGVGIVPGFAKYGGGYNTDSNRVIEAACGLPRL